MVEAVHQADGSYKLADGTVLKPPTQNQIRAEQLVESVFNDPELGAKLHDRAKKLFGDIKPHPASVLKETVVEPEVAAIRKQLEESNDRLSKALERLDARDKREEDEKVTGELQRSVKA